MIDRLKHHWNVSSRREFFTRAGSGLAGMALTSMLAETGYAGPAAKLDPILPKQTHHKPMASRRKWKQYGQSGMWVSDWYANVAEHVDDMTIIRSCWADGLNHVGSVCQMNTGSILAGRPSMGA